MELKFLHIIDDGKFVLNAINTCKKTKIGIHDSLVFMHHIEDTVSSEINELQPQKLCITEITKTTVNSILQNYDVVIFHNFVQKHKYKFLNLCSDNICTVWLSWGLDIYMHLDESNYVMTKTLKLQNEIYRPTLFLKTKTILYNLKKKYISRDINAYRRFDFFATCLPYEEKLVFNYLPKFKAKALQWSYPIKITDSVALHPSTNTLLLGNSATPSNNHIEALESIKKYKFVEKIIIPLSYGDHKYKEVLNREIGSLKGVVFLDEFISEVDYINLLKNCRWAYFNHIRQQALGNIIILLSLGKSVYLNPLSPQLRHFQEKGFIVYSTHDFGKIELNDEESLYNQNLCQRHYSESNFLEIAAKFLEKLTLELKTQKEPSSLITQQ